MKKRLFLGLSLVIQVVTLVLLATGSDFLLYPVFGSALPWGNLLTGFLLFLVGQGMIWYQTNSQFFNTWAKEHPYVMAAFGWPISYILIYASRYVVAGFEGLFGCPPKMILITGLIPYNLEEIYNKVD